MFRRWRPGGDERPPLEIGPAVRAVRDGARRHTCFACSRRSSEEALKQAVPATECTCTGSTQEIGGILWEEGEEW